MNHIHPSENTIQQFAIDKSDCTTAIIDHIESCASCKASAISYQLLFSEIKRTPKPAFDFDLSALVIPQLPLVPTVLPADRFIAGFLVIFICCCIGVPIILFWPYIQNIFSGISSFFIYTILISAIIILIIKVLEMYKKFQKQMQVLNFN
jgi:hypothetical protein